MAAAWTALVPGFPGDSASLNEAFAADATAAAPCRAWPCSVSSRRRKPSATAPGGMYLQLWPEENKEDGAPWSYLDTLNILSGTSASSWTSLPCW